LNSKATDHATKMLAELGWTAEVDAELARTPERFTTLLLGFSEFGAPPEFSTFPAESHEPILLTAIAFRSLCVHHVMPFFGYIDVAYVPEDRALGFGGIIRLIEHFSRKPQVQERLVQELGDHLGTSLRARGVLVRCRARQMCVEMRRTDATPVFITTHALGCLADGQLRGEAMAAFAVNEPAP
jgi:GTP cyclohydrolase I